MSSQTSRIPLYTHCTLYYGACIVLQQLGLELDKVLFGWNSVSKRRLELLPLPFIVGSSSDSRKARTATPTIYSSTW